MNKLSVPKPIIKWVGGKTQLIENLICKFPKEIKCYHEPFVGGGSVLFTLLSYVKEDLINLNEIYVSDSNEDLINLYKVIQNNHKMLYDTLIKFVNEFNGINNADFKTKFNSKQNYYYFIRRLYNSINTCSFNIILKSALFIFLNKTCFRGLYRVGPNGFNVPYGNNKNPEIINLEHLEEIHELIQGVTFNCCDFTHALSKVKNGDFVYLDPPYVPVDKNSFVGYNVDGFEFEKHKTLFDILKKVEYRYIMSNSDTTLVKEYFDKYLTVLAKRNINSKNPESKINELIVFN